MAFPFAALGAALLGAAARQVVKQGVKGGVKAVKKMAKKEERRAGHINKYAPPDRKNSHIWGTREILQFGADKQKLAAAQRKLNNVTHNNRSVVMRTGREPETGRGSWRSVENARSERDMWSRVVNDKMKEYGIDLPRVPK